MGGGFRRRIVVAGISGPKLSIRTCADNLRSSSGGHRFTSTEILRTVEFREKRKNPKTCNVPAVFAFAYVNKTSQFRS